MSLDGLGKYLSIKSMFDNPKIERVVFSFGIGEECVYKTLAEAFVGRLYSFENELSFAQNESELQKILDRKTEFLKTYKQELLPEERVESLLRDSLSYSQQKEMKYGQKNQNIDNECSSILNEDEFANVPKSILDQYRAVSICIEDLIEKEQDLTL